MRRTSRKMFRLSIGLLTVMVLSVAAQDGSCQEAIATDTHSSAAPELKLSLRDAIQAAIDNNVNVRLLKERIAAAQAQADTSLGAMLRNNFV